MHLTDLADFLLEKRFNEYRNLWVSDMQRQTQPGFMASMPGKVYQHWSGQQANNFEAIEFNLLLFTYLTTLSAVVFKILSMVEVAPLSK